MSKTNKKSINLGLKVLAILAFSSVFIPLNKAAADYVYSNGYVGYVRPIAKNEPARNPVPSVDSITPSSIDRSLNGKTITISGSGFVPGSVAKINGSNRSTTFIDYSHLIVQVNGSDINRIDGGFHVSVWNNAPGGGYSNAVFFTVNNTDISPVSGANSTGDNSYNSYTNTNNNSDTSNNYTNNTQTQGDSTTNSNASEQYSNLASNAVFGSNSFLPSGLIQWVLFAIIILLIVIIVRKIFGHAQDYHEAPMKHA